MSSFTQGIEASVGTEQLCEVDGRCRKVLCGSTGVPRQVSQVWTRFGWNLWCHDVKGISMGEWPGIIHHRTYRTIGTSATLEGATRPVHPGTIFPGPFPETGMTLGKGFPQKRRRTNEAQPARISSHPKMPDDDQPGRGGGRLAALGRGTTVHECKLCVFASVFLRNTCFALHRFAPCRRGWGGGGLFCFGRMVVKTRTISLTLPSRKFGTRKRRSFTYVARGA